MEHPTQVAQLSASHNMVTLMGKPVAQLRASRGPPHHMPTLSGQGRLPADLVTPIRRGDSRATPKVFSRVRAGRLSLLRITLTHALTHHSPHIPEAGGPQG